MPPRIARSSVAGPSSQKSSRKRPRKALDAFSLATREQPDQPRIRQNRLGKLEDDGFERKRRRIDEGHGNEEQSQKGSQLRKANSHGDNESEAEHGSDSEGNEWQMGHVEVDDDSDLDSDDAFGESDEERFEGFTFRGSAKSSKPKARPKRIADGAQALGGDIDLDDGSPDDEVGKEEVEDEDSLGEDAVDLATMLDEGTGSDTDESEDMSSGEDVNEDSESDSETEFSGYSDEDEEQDDNANGMLRLQTIVSSLQPQQEQEQPSAPNRTLTAAELLTGFEDSRTRKSSKVQAKAASKSNGAPKLEAPLPKRQQDRIDRAAANKKAKETLDRWIDTVKHNRRAEHLAFPLQDARSMEIASKTALPISANSAPFNDLESTVQNILEESGLSEKRKGDGEDQIRAFEQLRTNKMSLAEAQARRAELRQMRELLFREEVKAKRIKRIKSKAYRRVHRKERERVSAAEREALEATGVDVSDEERERHDRARAEARVGTKHRNSKWAKEMKQTGRGVWDDEARDSVMDMARRKEELMQRIQGKTIRDNVDDSDMSNSEDDDESVDFDGTNAENSARQHLQRQLDRLNQDGDIDEPRSKLHEMAFMRKANAAKRAQNEEDAQWLKKELLAEDGFGSSGEDSEYDGKPIGRRTFSAKQREELRSAEKEKLGEFEEQLPSDEEEVENERTEMENGISNGRKPISGTKSTPKPDHRKRSPERAENPALEENPWLVDAPQSREKQKPANVTSLTELSSLTNGANSSQKKISKQQKSSKKKAADVLIQPSEHSTNAADGEDNDKLAPFILRNQDLVQKAFAGDNVVASFTAEKDAAIASDSEKVVDDTLPGWGTWVGEGLNSKERKKINQRRVTHTEPGVKASDRKDAKLDKVIVSEKRAKKSTKYLAPGLPHPYESKAQYERAMRLPVGPEWTTKETFQEVTKPRVMVKQGVIRPMERPLM
ncbi:MAG: hypothetical protein M1820_000244 [Bogoriella megaspora]|nr:MAG: hypothetical protein M1820_000244 [Bogoriella megaspora]